MNALLERGIDDALRREPDALVDDFHAAIAGAHGDLLGTVGMTVEAGLADQHLDAPAKPSRHRVDLPPRDFEAAVGDAGGTRDTGRRTILAEHAAQRVRPFAGGDAGLGAGDRGRHDVAVFLGGGDQLGKGCLHRSTITIGAPGVQPLDLAALDRIVDRQDRILAAGKRRGRALGVGVDADHGLLADSMAARRFRFDSTRRCFM